MNIMLRRSLIRCTNYRAQRLNHQFRAIGAIRNYSDDKPSRQIYDMYSEKLHIDELLTRQGRRPFEPLVDDPIIVKKFFVSKVEKEQMLYPEAVSKSKLDEINVIRQKVDEYFDDDISFDGNGISDSVHEEFKNLNLYGYNLPTKYGGSGYTQSELLVVAEPEGRNANVALALCAHRLACKNILDFGTIEQHAKYLPGLAKGDLVATVAYDEWNKDDLVNIKTNAEYDDDDDQWTLNGTKSFVFNAPKSNLLMVLAETKTSDRKGDMSNSMTIFLVDSSAPGVTIHKKDNTIGCNELYQSKVSFKNVVLQPDSVLSIPGTGNHVVQHSHLSLRLAHSLINMMQMKELSKFMIDLLESIEQQTMENNTETAFAIESNSLRMEIAKSICAVYAIESMLYMTAGIMDTYENTNTDVETSILKTFSQDHLLSMATSLFNFIDTRIAVSEHPVNHLIRDAIQLQTIGEPKDTLKLFVGISGIQYSGEHSYEQVKQKRNPLFNPEFALKNFFANESLDKYNSNLTIKESVVTEFDLPVSWLEASIERLRIGTSTLMEVHGRNLPKEHCEIQRLAEAATLNYVSYSSLLRANRSWVLQLPEAADERVIAGCICDANGKRVKQLMQCIEDGPLATFEVYYQHVTKMLIKNKSYFPVHPLTRFF